MRRRASLILTLAAWLLATGSHWDLVQTFAWGRMIAVYSESMPLLKAVEKTFSGDAVCGICELVQAGKQQQDAAGTKAADTNAPAKLFLACAPSVLVFASPVTIQVGLLPSASAPLSAGRDAPPSPPPRVLA